jgi:hypothetical protein
MVLFALKILLCHLLGDFVLQSNKMIAQIKRRGLRAPSLYLHAAIHFALLLWVGVLPALCLAAVHLAIDMLTKIALRKKLSPVAVFVLDQVLHLVSIVVFVNWFYPFTLDAAQLFVAPVILMALAVVLLTFVSSIAIKKMLDAFNFKLPKSGMSQAGKYIGMLERLFIFVFIINGFWEGVGYLLAAKSIFRFGDLKENKDIQLTEYILIGTLISFGIAVLVAVTYLQVQTLV